MATRREVLDLQGIAIQQGTYSQSESPTLSTHRARWHSLQWWSSFTHAFETFWSQVGDLELSTVVDRHRYIDSIQTLLQINVTALPTSERQLYPIFDILYKMPHNLAVSGNVSQFHATIQPGAAEYQPIGDPDYIFELSGALVGIIEVKTFWKVTCQLINEVIDSNLGSPIFILILGTAPLEGYHSGRLAIEQTYGYMVRNGRKYGILTTVNGFAFLCRENYGRLFMTRLVTSSVTLPTILKMLYYMSFLTATAPPLPETDVYGRTLAIPAANYKYPVAAPQLPGPPASPSNHSQIHQPFGHSLGSTYQYVLVQASEDHPGLVIEPWIQSNCLGGKTFRGLFLPDKDVVVKLWDSYTHNATDRDNEVEAYMKLQALWGLLIPRFLCSAEFDFCWGIVLEHVEVMRVSNPSLIIGNATLK